MKKIDVRRVAIYLAIAFGFSWSVAGVIYLTGGFADSAPMSPGSSISWALPLLTRAGALTAEESTARIAGLRQIVGRDLPVFLASHSPAAAAHAPAAAQGPTTTAANRHGWRWPARGSAA